MKAQPRQSLHLALEQQPHDLQLQEAMAEALALDGKMKRQSAGMHPSFIEIQIESKAGWALG